MFPEMIKSLMLTLTMTIRPIFNQSFGHCIHNKHLFASLSVLSDFCLKLVIIGNKTAAWDAEHDRFTSSGVIWT